MAESMVPIGIGAGTSLCLNNQSILGKYLGFKAKSEMYITRNW